MELYPLNLVLAVATAWGTLFLGFLPARTLAQMRGAIGQAALAWGAVAATANPAIWFWPLLVDLACGWSWWQLRVGRTLAGRTVLWIASGVGIGLAVVYLIQTSPALPRDIPAGAQLLLIASIYLGGAATGLAWATRAVVSAWIRDATPGLPVILGQLRLLAVLTVAQAAVVLMQLKITAGPLAARFHGVSSATDGRLLSETMVVALITGGLMVLFACILVAWRAVHSSQPRAALGALSLVIFSLFLQQLIWLLRT